MNLKKNKKKIKGFTLVETLISITIFGIILVSMTGIVLNLVKVSLLTDRRNDFLNELNNAVSNIKNEMRNAETIGLCAVGPNPGTNGTLFVSKKNSIVGDPFLQLGVSIDPNTKQGRLVWNVLTANPAENANKCILDPAASPKFLTTDTIDISFLTFNSVNDSSDVPNYLIYTSFWACDNPAIVNKVFDCTPTNTADKAPYKYMFAISTRNN